MSINRGMDKEEVECVCVSIYICLAIKKNEIIPFAGMHLEIIISREVSQKKKDKYHIYHLPVESQEMS